MFRPPISHKRLRTLAAGLAIAVLPIGVTLVTATAPQAAQAAPTPPPRPQGPCDIYGAAGTPCVAAHSTTRALYAAYLAGRITGHDRAATTATRRVSQRSA